MPFDLSHGAPQRIAIIGGGISGLSAAWLLSGHHRVTVFEADHRFGGHARTVLAGRNGQQPVDTGFIVFNYANYPHLTSLFRDLDVPVEKSDMSFGVSLDSGRLEFALRTANAMFGQRSNVLNPGFYGMLRDIMRFNDRAEEAAREAPGVTIAELLLRLRLGARFRDHYLFPICGAIWSTPTAGIGRFPAEAVLRFMRNHGLMAAGKQHQWWTVSGGSVGYIDRLLAALRQRQVDLRAGSPVLSASRGEDAVTLRVREGVEETFDQVIFACHSDQTLDLLVDPSPREIAALSAIKFQPNRAVLHRDPRVMPRRRQCWSSWVYRTEAGADAGSVGVTYWMNRLQNIPDSDPLFVSLNPAIDLPCDAIYDEVLFRHPVFDKAALDAQDEIAAIQGRQRSWFAGAWLRNGFHEDGFASAARIARQLLPESV